MTKAILRKMAWFVCKIVVLLSIAIPLLLLVGQQAMIYHGRPYRPSSQAARIITPCSAKPSRKSTTQWVSKCRAVTRGSS